MIGGYIARTVPMREQSVGVFALRGRLDLRSRQCRFQNASTFNIRGLTGYYSISTLGERLLRLEKAVSAPLEYDEHIQPVRMGIANLTR